MESEFDDYEGDDGFELWHMESGNLIGYQSTLERIHKFADRYLRYDQRKGCMIFGPDNYVEKLENRGPIITP
jgi:hypothetical protein